MFHIRKNNEIPNTNISFSPDNTSVSRTAQNATNPPEHIAKNDASVTGACAQRCPFCEVAGLYKTTSFSPHLALFILLISPLIFSDVPSRNRPQQIVGYNRKAKFIGSVTEQTLNKPRINK